MNGSPEDLEALKARLRSTWSAGDYGKIAKGLEASAEEFLARVGVGREDRVLDVACGAGQIAIPAARAGARVTGIDIAENWIEQARERAAAEGLDVRFEVGDAEALPYDDAAFDLTISLIGAMFAPRPERVAAELKRVTRPGGRIVMGNWPAHGFVGGFFAIISRYVPPPEGMPSPLLWGDEQTVRERFSEGVTDLTVTEHPYHFHHAEEPEKVVEFYRSNFGPIVEALNALDEDSGRALQDELLRHWRSYNHASDGTTQVTGNIMEVVAVRA